MNLQYLFEIQAGLDAHIEEEHPRKDGEDRLSKKILALQVELGELANEWRGFKFWSKDQEPREYSSCKNCTGQRLGYFSGKQYTGYKEICTLCDGTGKDDSKNPLLEEYVDGLHFFLSVGIELGINEHQSFVTSRTKDIMTLFALVNRYVAEMWWEHHDNTGSTALKWLFAFQHYLQLGEMLGFTWKQIEVAYLEKNKINHERQVNGY